MTDIMKLADHACDCSRLIGITEANRAHGNFTQYDSRFLTAMQQSKAKHVAALQSAIEALQGENERLKQEWNRFHHLLKNHGLHPGRTDDDLLAILEAALAKLDELQRQEPVGYTDSTGIAFAVKWSGALPPNLTLYAAPKALEPLSCTCPSGDGSLRWPCPQHPPEEESGADCTPNHNCNGRMVHLPDGEHCDHCGITKGTP